MMTDGVFLWTNNAGAAPDPEPTDDSRRRRSFVARVLPWLAFLVGG